MPRTQRWRRSAMRLDKVTIPEFKNLKDLTIDFDETSPYTVLVGENGSGKSNLIEALAIIFRDIDLDVEVQFSFDLEYRCRGRKIRVAAEANHRPRFWVFDDASADGKELSRKQFREEDENGRPLYRPAFVFGYYSGPSD